MFSKISSVLLCFSLPPLLLAQQGYRRSQFGEVAATAVEQVASRLYSQTTIRWDDSVWLTDSSGQPREIGFPGFLQTRTRVGYTFATCIEFVGERQQAVKRLSEFMPASVAAQATVLAVFKTTEKGDVMALRHGRLFPAPTLTQCIDIEVRKSRPDPGWPLLEVRFASFHQEEDWTGGLEWLALIETESMSTTELLPTRLWKTRKQGQTVREHLQVIQGGAGVVNIRAMTTGRTLRITCGTPCLPSPQELLRGEW